MLKEFETIEKVLSDLLVYNGKADGEKIKGGVEGVLPLVKQLKEKVSKVEENNIALEKRVEELSKDKNVQNLDIMNKLEQVVEFCSLNAKNSESLVHSFDSLSRDVRTSQNIMDANTKNIEISQKFIETLTNEYKKDRTTVSQLNGAVDSCKKDLRLVSDSQADIKQVLDTVNRSQQLTAKDLNLAKNDIEETKDITTRLRKDLEKTQKEVETHDNFIGKLKGLFNGK